MQAVVGAFGCGARVAPVAPIIGRMDAGAASSESRPERAARRAVAVAEPPDEQLMRDFAAGDELAFQRLYDRHERAVYRFLLRSVGHAETAEDLLQEAWISVARNAAGYEPRARFTTWLFGIARTRLIDHWRARDPAVLLSLDEPIGDGAEAPPWSERIAADPSSEPEEIALGRERERALVRAVEALPAAQREALLLQSIGGLTLAQIAELTGAGIETIKSRLRYAAARLRADSEEWR